MDLNEHEEMAMDFDPRLGFKVPNENDILCGRGRSTSDHAANVRFRTLVSQHQKAYQVARRREEKSRITEELVNNLRSTGRCVSLARVRIDSTHSMRFVLSQEALTHSFSKDSFCLNPRVSYGMKFLPRMQERKYHIHFDHGRNDGVSSLRH